MKKILMALLCAALLPLWAGAYAAENTPVPIEPAEAFAGGSGTAEDPFQIANAQQLALLAKVTNQEYDWDHLDERDLYQNGYYVLTADISLNDTSNFANWESEPPSMGESLDKRGFSTVFFCLISCLSNQTRFNRRLQSSLL